MSPNFDIAKVAYCFACYGAILDKKKCGGLGRVKLTPKERMARRKMPFKLFYGLL